MRTPSEATPTWRLCNFVFNIIRPLVGTLQVSGLGNIPSQGGAVLACNHPGGTDSFVLGYASPRQVYYMAKRELFHVHPLVTYFLHGIGAFPINRGARDTGAIEYGVELLREGKVVGMFPEGTRNRGKPLRRGKSGAVRMALEADVPVVPVAVLGVPHLHENWNNPFRPSRLSIQFGTPIRFEQGTMEEVQAHTSEVMLAIARMMPTDLRGHYGEAFRSSRDRTRHHSQSGEPNSPGSARANDIAPG